MRVFVTGGGGVLGRAVRPLLEAGGHGVVAPARAELDLLEPGDALAGVGAVLHLATRIPPPERQRDREAWRENDTLRAEVTPVLVDAALAAGAETFVVPTVAFVYPSDAPADEDTPVTAVASHLESALAAERAVERFATAGRRGVVLRLGLLDGPGTGLDAPLTAIGATLHVDDAATALLAALDAPAGLYNVTRDGERVSNARFRRAAGWRPTA